jgi:hypothetical protein
MDDRLIHHPMFPKSRTARHGGPSATVIAALVAALLVVALLFPSVGRVGVDSQDQPLRPVPGLGL